MRLAAIDNGAYIHMSDDGGQTWRVAGQGQSLELVYLGNGRFGVASHEGGPFTIR